MRSRKSVQVVVGMLLSVTALGASTSVPRVLRPGETRKGTILVGDVNRAGISFELEVALPTTLTIEARSFDFDTFLTIWRVGPNVAPVEVGEDDNGGTGTDSRFAFEAEAAVHYRIEVQPSSVVFCGGNFEASVTVGRLEATDAKVREQANQAYWTRLDDRARKEATPECTVEALLRRWSLGLEQDRPREARPDFEKALAVAEERLGPEHLLVARCLLAKGRVLISVGSAPDARPLVERALAIYEKELGPDHPAAASALSLLGIVDSKTGAHAEATRSFERALTILEKAHGPDSSAVGRCLINLGLERWRMGEYAEAMPLLQKSLRIFETNLGSNAPVVARSVHNIAILLAEAGEYARAKPYFERALAIEEKAYGPEDDSVAEKLNGLGLNLKALGDYAGARPVLERALAIREKMGADSVAVGGQAYNLGLLFTETGDYAQARAFLERALRIDEKFNGPEHRFVAEDLVSLATVLREIGDYSEAKRLLDRALTISQKVLGPDHPDVAANLVSLGRLLQAMESFLAAKTIYERALLIQEKKLGPEHPSVATTLTALAGLCSATGEYSEARVLLERALAIQEKQLGPEHVDVSYTLGALAGVRRTLGSNAEAKPLYERAIAVAEKQFGPDNISIAPSLDGLAVLLAETGQNAAALDAALREERIGREQLRLTARVLPERQALRYASVRDSGLDLAVSLAEHLGPTERQEVWDAVIRSRALVLDEMGGRHHAVLASGDPEVGSLFKNVTSATQRLANLTVRGPGDDPPERYRGMLDDERRTREDAERALAEKSSAFRQEVAKNGVGYQEVAGSLPPGSTLVAYVLYGRYEVPGERAKAKKGSVAGHDERKPVPSYLVFVLRGGSAEATVLPLGAAKDVDALISAWQREAARGAFVPGRSASEVGAAYRSAGDALRTKVWDPVAARLKGASRVFVVPDGALYLVSLASLPTGKSEYLIESGPLLHYLSAERDLVPAPATRSNGKGLLALGGAAFDETSLVATSSTFRGERSGCGDFQSIRFEALPGSAREVEAIAGLWLSESRPATAADELTGAGATEAAFKRDAPGHRILHLATHGFFLGGRCASALDASRGVTGLVTAEVAATTPQRVIGENPLLLSGLALAGANHRDAAGPDEEDGILSAEEIAALDLSGVEWAVLSACDTGVGEIKAGEGVFGLRRAFAVAGARTLIMSLWSVDDEATRFWMKTLYEGRMRKGLDTAQAVREASLSVLRERRAKKESSHPFYWAGFVATGDWK